MSEKQLINSLISNNPIQKTHCNKAVFAGMLNSNIAKAKGDSFVQEGHFDKAINWYQKALAYDYSDIDAHLSIAQTYSYNGQYKEAIPHIEAYIQAKPKDIEAITFLGECCKKSGMFSKSIEHFNKALEIEPHYDYARRNLLDAQNLYLQCIDPVRGKKERYNTAVQNLTEAVKIAKTFLPKGYTNSMKDVTVSFDKTAKMGGRSNIAQYEHTKRKISVTDEYTYADPRLTGAYLIHEFVHGKDNDAYTSIREEQDAYRAQAQYWTKNVKDLYDPEMDYVADLYKQSAKTLDDRVEEIYKQRDPMIPEISYNHPPKTGKITAHKIRQSAGQPLKEYDVIV